MYDAPAPGGAGGVSENVGTLSENAKNRELACAQNRPDQV
jgi:hypothetical protein